jgi:DNA-binding MarR family transcriptional regulator
MKPKTGHDVVDAILYAAHRIRTRADASLREYGLSLPAYKVLRALEDSDQSMREVSEILHVSPRTVTDIVDSLEARGLVARGPHPADRRVTLLHLTADGQRQLATAAALADKSHGAAISALSAQDQQTLLRLLDQVAPTDQEASADQAASADEATSGDQEASSGLAAGRGA